MEKRKKRRKDRQLTASTPSRSKDKMRKNKKEDLDLTIQETKRRGGARSYSFKKRNGPYRRLRRNVTEQSQKKKGFSSRGKRGKGTVI